MLNYLNIVPYSAVKQRFFGSCIFCGIECWSTYRPICRLILGWESVEYRPSIDGYLGQEVFSCHCRISRQINQQLVEIALVVCRQRIGELSIEYQWGIGGDPWPLRQPNVGDMSTISQQSNGQLSIDRLSQLSVTSISVESQPSIGRHSGQYIDRQSTKMLTNALIDSPLKDTWSDFSSYLVKVL